MAVSPSLIAEAVGWRREFHAAPELGYQEQETSRRVAELLASFGLQVHRGLAGTGVVATLENGPGPVIGLRADMDALPITELGSVSYRSRRAGVMHACGHDGHTAMLLAAAAHLAQTRHFSGTVHFVFQPAEENLGGARKMVEEGLFERFPMDAIYALHNWPGIPLGEVALSDDGLTGRLRDNPARKELSCGDAGERGRSDRRGGAADNGAADHSFPPLVAAGFRGGQHHPDKRRRGDQRPPGHRGAARYLPLSEQSRSRPRAGAHRKLCGDPAAGVRCAGRD